jgi:hypothetical protein
LTLFYLFLPNNQTVQKIKQGALTGQNNKKKTMSRFWPVFCHSYNKAKIKFTVVSISLFLSSITSLIYGT